MEASPAELQRRLAAEFDRQGWEYDLAVGPDLLAKIENGTEIDAEKYVAGLPPAFFQRNRTTRADVVAAVERAVGGLTPKSEAPAATLVISDNRYQVNLGPGAQISDTNINVGEGTQVNIDVGAPKDSVLAALEILLRAGLAGGWNSKAAGDLASLIDRRDDIDVDDVRETTKRVVQAEAPKRERARELLTQIAVGGLGGALSTGISAGIGELLSQLPL